MSNSEIQTETADRMKGQVSFEVLAWSLLVEVRRLEREVVGSVGAGKTKDAQRSSAGAAALEGWARGVMGPGWRAYAEAMTEAPAGCS